VGIAISESQHAKEINLALKNFNSSGPVSIQERRSFARPGEEYLMMTPSDPRQTPTSPPQRTSALATGRILEILRPLLLTHSPTGHEDEATAWVQSWLRERLREVNVDDAGNVIARAPGTGDRPPVCLIAHKDEIGFIIKRIEPDGKIRIGRVGGSYPWKYGEGPVDLLGDGDPTPGFLCFGSLHCSAESRDIWDAKNSKNLTWEVCWVDAKLSCDELASRGVHVGTKGVLSRSRKALVEMEGFVGGFALDDKALIAVMLALAEQLADRPAPRDVYLIASAGEEIGSGRAAFAAGNTPAETFLALEIAPVLPEYGVEASLNPVVMYKDEYNIYDETVCRELEVAAILAGLKPQRAVLSSFGSDVSFGAKSGRFARYGCIAVPCENTHGYEIVPRESLGALARTIDAWLRK